MLELKCKLSNLKKYIGNKVKTISSLLFSIENRGPRGIQIQGCMTYIYVYTSLTDLKRKKSFPCHAYFTATFSLLLLFLLPFSILFLTDVLDSFLFFLNHHSSFSLSLSLCGSLFSASSSRLPKKIYFENGGWGRREEVSIIAVKKEEERNSGEKKNQEWRWKFIFFFNSSNMCIHIYMPSIILYMHSCFLKNWRVGMILTLFSLYPFKLDNLHFSPSNTS